MRFRSANAKFNKARTVVLLPPVIHAPEVYLAGKAEGWLFPGYGGRSTLQPDKSGALERDCPINSLAFTMLYFLAAHLLITFNFNRLLRLNGTYSLLKHIIGELVKSIKYTLNDC
jgi:hypothetical protein